MAINRKQVFENILFPTDFSDASVNAAAYALNLARSKRAKLRVMHVLDTSNEAQVLRRISRTRGREGDAVAAREMLDPAQHFAGARTSNRAWPGCRTRSSRHKAPRAVSSSWARSAEGFERLVPRPRGS